MGSDDHSSSLVSVPTFLCSKICWGLCCPLNESRKPMAGCSRPFNSWPALPALPPVLLFFSGYHILQPCSFLHASPSVWKFSSSHRSSFKFCPSLRAFMVFPVRWFLPGTSSVPGPHLSGFRPLVPFSLRSCLLSPLGCQLPEGRSSLLPLRPGRISPSYR